MFENAKRTHKYLLKVLMFLGNIFGILIFKIDESNSIVKSRSLRIYNKILVVLVTFITGLIFFIGFTVVKSDITNMKLLVGIAGNFIYSILSFSSFYFVSVNHERMRNHFFVLSRMFDTLYENKSQVKIFSRFLIFDFIFIHTFVFLSSILMVALTLYYLGLKELLVLLFSSVSLFIYPARLLIVFSLLVIHINAGILEVVSNSNKKLSSVLNVFRITEESCKIYKSLFIIYISNQFFFMVFFTFATVSLITLQNFESEIKLEYFGGQAINLVFMMVEVVNLKTMIDIMENFKFQVKRN